MKRLLTAFVFCLVAHFQSYAQSFISDQDWSNIITSLDNEDWKKADDLAKLYLQRFPADQIDADAPAILRYMYLLSEAGLMGKKKLTQQQALKDVKEFQGHTLILPGHPISMKEGFNSIELSNGKPDTLMIASTNKVATEIYSFEYIVPKQKYDLDYFKSNAGRICRIGGWLRSVSVEGRMFPRYRLLITEAELDIK